MIATSLSLADVAVGALALAVVASWLALVIHVMGDVLRSRDLSGAAMAAWAVALLALPIVGAVVYLVTRGATMHEREVRALQAQRQAFEDYIRSVANTKE
ncbi:MAG TPA: PLDc N-terminal domain-containing protein [Acidimicrobiales bacterium]|nr:PLDc N-terminal domain-containing protein [Acidimicrobiales bacterium]